VSGSWDNKLVIWKDVKKNDEIMEKLSVNDVVRSIIILQ
jgi:hypothetical protein